MIRDVCGSTRIESGDDAEHRAARSAGASGGEKAIVAVLYAVPVLPSDRRLDGCRSCSDSEKLAETRPVPAEHRDLERIYEQLR